jgi:hypothetical protein
MLQLSYWLPLLTCHMHVAYAVCRSAEGQGAVSKEAAQLGYGSLLTGQNSNVATDQLVTLAYISHAACHMRPAGLPRARGQSARRQRSWAMAAC